MKERERIDLGIPSYEELLMNAEQREENRLPKIYNLKLDEIDDFPDHPFKVRMDEDMEQLVASVKERGVIVPITVRQKEDGRYELISGHRRRKACELAGLETAPAEIKNLTRDEAVLLMVDSNLQRSTILPSEKAFAYRMKLEAMNRQGQRTDLTSVPVAQKLGTSRDMVGESVGESGDQVRRYIRLTYLTPELLQLVDDGKMALRPAVTVSYFTEQEQQDLYTEMLKADCTPSHAQTLRMKMFSDKGTLTAVVIEAILGEEKGNQKETVKLGYNDCRKYIPESVPFSETKNYILKALEYYSRHQEHMKSSRDSR